MTPEVVLPVEPLEMLVKDKLYVLRNAVSNETCEHLAKEYLMIKDIVEETSQGPTSDLSLIHI